MKEKKNKIAILLLLLLLVLGAVASIYFGVTKKDETGQNMPTKQEAEEQPSKQESQAEKDDGIYKVKVLKCAHGSVTVNKTEAAEGEEIVLKVKADKGYEIKSLTVNKKKSETTFKMPAEDVRVLAKFSLVVGKGDFFGKSGKFESSDVINFNTDKGRTPYLKMDAKKGSPLYAYVNDLNAKQFFFETDVKVTDILKSEKYPKFGIMTNDGSEMVKFYLDMNTKKQVSSVGAVHQPNGKDDDWDNQDSFLLDEKLKLSKDTVKLGFLRNGNAYYFYVNGEVVAAGSNLSAKTSATGVFSFGTSLKLTNYKLVKAGDSFNELLEKAEADAKKFNAFKLTTNYFKETEDGVYTLKTNSDDEGKVDDVKYAGQILKTAYYSIKGKVTLTDAEDWSQARILISSDPKNEYVIALEQTTENKYQIFTMSKDNEEVWNEWKLIAHAEAKSSKNSIDFEVVVDGDKIYFLVDNEICYTGDRVSMKESTVKFASYNKGTTIVKNIDGKIFGDSKEVQEYLATKSEKAYESPFQERIDAMYQEYFVDNNCVGKGGTLLLGHSHMDRGFWNAWEAQTGLTNYVNGYNVGIGGTTTMDWLYAYDKLVKPFDADRFVISLGENDITGWGATGEEVVGRLTELFEKIHNDHPEAEIYYIHSLPAQTKYQDGKWLNSQYASLVKGEKELCDSLEYVEGISMFDLLVDAETDEVKTGLYLPNKDIHLNADGYVEWSDRLYDLIFKGENFGVTKVGDTYYKTTNGIELENDHGKTPIVDIFGGAPRYAYLNDTYADKLYFETEMTVSEILNEDVYPKFGLILNGETESLKFFVDMREDMKASAVGVVHQPTDGEDDWANSVSANVDNMKFTNGDKIKLVVVRDGEAYYFYVNGELVLVEEYAFTDEKSAVGIFSFNTVLTATNYQIFTESEADSYIAKSKEDAKFTLSTYHFIEKADGVYALATDSDNEGRVDNVERAGKTVRAAYYSVKGNISLTDAADWGQARILISADPENEYVIALERTNANKYQIFTMSKDGEKGWSDWRLISHADVNRTRNSLDFEVVVIADKMYFLIDDQIYYTSDRVNMTESTVKFAGYNNATTTVQNLEGKIFKTKTDAKEYLATKSEKAYESAFQAQIDARYKEYFEDRDCSGKGGTVILGHSHVDAAFWNDWENQTGLTKYVNGYNVGIGGTTTLDWLYAYEKIVKPFDADRFVISVGENDITGWGRDGAEVVESLSELFKKIHTDHPNAAIYYIYSLPAATKYANGQWLDAEYKALVKGEKELCESLEYVQGIDTFNVLVDSDARNVKTELYGTNNDIHLNQEGYKVWSAYLYDQIFKGVNFGVTVGGGVTYKTTNGIELINDKGNNATLSIFGGVPRYAYLNDSYTNKFYFEAEVNVREVLNNDGYPKFGLMFNGKSEMVKYFVDMNPQMEASHVGVVHQKTGQGDDWGNSISTAVSGMKFKGSDKVKLALVRDGRDYYFYVNDALVLSRKNMLYNENGAVGIFSFNAVMTVSNYKFYKDADADSYIAAAKAVAGANFFGAANGLTTTLDVDLSKDTGATTGVATVNTGDSKFMYARDFYQENYYFETKVHVNQVYNNDAWPKFGILVQDGAVQELFFVDMRPDKTSSTVGVVHDYNWGTSISTNVNGMKFSGKGEYVTLGLLKQGGTFKFYVNGNQALTYNSSFKGKTTVGVFGFNTGMTLKEYYVERR